MLGPVLVVGQLLDKRYRLEELLMVEERAEVWQVRVGRRARCLVLVRPAPGEDTDLTAARHGFLRRAGELALDRSAWTVDDRLLGYCVLEDYEQSAVSYLCGEFDLAEELQPRRLRAGLVEFFVFVARDPWLLCLVAMAAMAQAVWNRQLDQLPDHEGWLFMLEWVVGGLARLLAGATLFVGLVLWPYVRRRGKVGAAARWLRAAWQLAGAAVVAAGLRLAI